MTTYEFIRNYKIYIRIVKIVVCVYLFFFFLLNTCYQTYETLSVFDKKKYL